MKCASPVTNGDCSGTFDDQAADWYLMSTNASYCSKIGIGKKAHWSSVHCKECSVALGGKLKYVRVPPLHLSKCDYCPTPNRFIYMNLSELILASLLKLLSNNDVEASVRSHAFFFERVRLFLASKVHSPLSRKDFPAVTLVLPTMELLLHITALDQRQPQKSRRHTNCTERVSLVIISSRNRSTDKPVSVNRCEYRISRPYPDRVVLKASPYRGQVRCTCFCLGLPFASLLKSNNCLLFTRLTSARCCVPGCVQHMHRSKMLQILQHLLTK